MKDLSWTCLGRLCLAALVGALLSTAASGTVVVYDVRTPMPDEGYLEYQASSPDWARYGHEYTGWVDVRHPAMEGTTKAYEPYDRSDRYVMVHSTTCSDANGVAASPDAKRDFDFSCKTYAQAGLSVVRESFDTLKLDGTGGAPNVTWPIDGGNDDSDMKALSRSGNATTVNAWYVQQYVYKGDHPTGLCSYPKDYGGSVPRRDGFGVADAAGSSTFAHELGHMLLNGHASEDNNDSTNFMYKNKQDYALTDVGKTKGIMTTEQMERVFSDPGPNNPGFTHKPNDHPAFGNIVDWNYIADDWHLEPLSNGLDNHPTHDRMYWTAGAPACAEAPGHDHTGLGNFSHPGAFTGTFRMADMFSLTMRYMDFEESWLYSRTGALDYEVTFVDASGGLHDGVPVKEFVLGWTLNTCVDNYLTRWLSPVPAVGLYVHAKSGGDANCQIDAVIVSAIPEPASLAILPAGGLALLRRRRRRPGPGPGGHPQRPRPRG